jgi:hypothetical protein
MALSRWIRLSAYSPLQAAASRAQVGSGFGTRMPTHRQTAPWDLVNRTLKAEPTAPDKGLAAKHGLFSNIQQ